MSARAFACFADAHDMYLSLALGGVFKFSSPSPTAGSTLDKDSCGFTIPDQELVSLLSRRGALHRGDGIQVVLLNGCNTSGACIGLHNSRGIPMVVGWAAAFVPSQQCLAVVSVLGPPRPRHTCKGWLAMHSCKCSFMLIA